MENLRGLGRLWKKPVKNYEGKRRLHFAVWLRNIFRSPVNRRLRNRIFVLQKENIFLSGLLENQNDKIISDAIIKGISYNSNLIKELSRNIRL